MPVLKTLGHELRRAAEVAVRESMAIIWDIDLDLALDRAGQHIYLPAVAPDKRNADGSPIYYESQIIGDEPFAFAGSTIEREANRIIEDE